MNHHDRINVLWSLSLVATVALLFVGRIPQDGHYHQFADNQILLGIQNFWNVFSNVPFLLVGAWGLWRGKALQTDYKHDYQTLCLGVLLVSFGSAYYHHVPSTFTLLWDRLPMTVAFMALFSMLLKERVCHTALPLSRTLISLGMASALYWYWTETQQAGDLRAYILVQFLPMLLIPAILYFFDCCYLNGKYLITALAYYVVAKLFEHFDRQVFELIGLFSGHTLKHFLASIASWYIILAVPVTDRT